MSLLSPILKQLAQQNDHFQALYYLENTGYFNEQQTHFLKEWMQEAFSSIQQHDKEYNKQRAQLNQKTTQHQEAQEAENLLEAL